eukprot:snap_masked-scaffold25_size650667-processed-gene-0.0 protein:Tk06679 transcript:snap_masked-scaffold25_size650667-processed-gene-0.0-mRNA-1 annotation:"serine threonine-protein kinase rio3"
MATGNAWGVSGGGVAAPSLTDVMSEELARDLQAQDERVESEVGLTWVEVATEPCDDDLLIAQMLQDQFDREADAILQHEEQHANGTSKVTVSYSKYRVVPAHPLFDEDDTEEEDEAVDDRRRDWDCYETQAKTQGELPRCGYKVVGGQVVTKHDRDISQRNNGRRIMEFPPGIETGDGGGMDMMLSNQVYNKIRNFSNKAGKRRRHVHDKTEKATTELAIDPATKLLLFKYVDRGILDSITGAVSTGKEAVILHAEGGPGPDDVDQPMNIPRECAIKVFKTTLNEFKTREKYIRDDYRFRDRFSHQNPRRVVHMWAEKEMHNLRLMAKHGVPVPEAILLKKHVLLMAFIGRDATPAPKLKDALMSDGDLKRAYTQVVEGMTRIYEKCQLIHADLSEYNILWHDQQCWFIDVSQSVEPNHPHGLEFLLRDCTNMTKFFDKAGVPDVMSATELFTHVSGLELKDGPEAVGLLSQIQNYVKHDQLMRCDVEDEAEDADNFDYCWDQSQTSDRAASASRPIPGHGKGKSAWSKGGKSPKSPKSPISSLGAKSPKSPSGRSYASLTDRELQDMKESIHDDEVASPRRESMVKFQEPVLERHELQEISDKSLHAQLKTRPMMSFQMPIGENSTGDVRSMLDGLGYRNKERTHQDIVTTVTHYRGLIPRVEKFMFNDGIEKSLICLKGTIPVTYRDSQYNIPVSFWILDTHPLHAPMAYVCPTADMQIRVSRHVDHTGKVYLPYLHEWNTVRSDLPGLVQVCGVTFGDQPPVFARGATNPTPNPPVSVANGSNTSTISGEHIRASLMSAVEDKIRRALREEFSTKQAEMESLKKVKEELEARRTRLTNDVTMCNRAMEEIRTKLPYVSQLQRDLASAEDKIDESKALDTDSIVNVSYPLLAQLCKAHCEDSAIEDSLYYLGNGLRNGVVNCETFLKTVRKLSRDQFFKKVVVQKCREKAKLGLCDAF